MLRSHKELLRGECKKYCAYESASRFIMLCYVMRSVLLSSYTTKEKKRRANLQSGSYSI